MSKKVEINGCKAETMVKKSKNLKFHSSDGSAYTIDSSDGSKFSDDLPLLVPADGTEVKLKIKKDAVDGSYELTIEGDSCGASNVPQPIMIIKVG
jgi:HSP90 family molecular chaperone